MSRLKLTTASHTDSPYHPDYGLPDSKRINAVADSYVTSVAKSAQAHRVAESSIYKWRKVYHVTPHYYA